MIKDGMFFSSEITADNILQITEKQCRFEEMRICELSELADSAVEFALAVSSVGYDIYEILSLISEGFLNSENVILYDTLAENKIKLDRYINILTAQDKVIFSSILTEKLCKAGISVSESILLPEDCGNGIFTYVKNSLSDEAYDVFSQEFPDPRLKYANSFKEVVSSVVNGECEYAILPLEEKGGVRLFSVASLIHNEDLKINSVIPVFGFEGNADMKYALVSKHFTVPEIKPDDDRYLEIRLRSDSSVPISELLSSAVSMGVSVYRVNTVAFNTEDGPVNFHSVVFRDGGEDFSKLLVYLTLFSGAYTALGIYKNLE